MITVLDVRRLGKEHPPWHLSIIDSEGAHVYTRFRPYFYLITHKSLKLPEIRHSLTSRFSEAIELARRAYSLKKILSDEEYQQLIEEPYTLQETDMEPWVYYPSLGRYIRDRTFRVFKVTTWIPWTVKYVGQTFVGGGLVRAAAMNIVYVARFVLDNYFARPLNIIPIYYDLDTEIMDKLSKVEYHVYDLEILKDGTRVLSILKVRLFEDIDLQEARKRVEECKFVYKKPDDPEAEEARKVLKEAKVLVGYNILHYDNKRLVRDRILDPTYSYTKCVIDLCELLKNQAQAAGVGQASLALQDVIYALKDKLGVSSEEVGKMITIKMLGAKMLTRLDQAIEYNINDVLVTWRLAELFLPYAFGVAGLIQVPPSAVQRLRPGQLFEYALVHWFEIHNQIIEARQVFTSSAERLLLKGEKVFTFKDILEFWQAYREKIEQLTRTTSDLNTIVRELRKIADEILKKIIKPRSIKKKQKRETLETLVTGKIVHMDVEMMYPTKIKNAKIGPECWVRGVAEDAEFAADREESPFYAFVCRLYEARLDLKEKKKQAKKMKEKLKQEGKLDPETEKKLSQQEALYDLLSNLVKPLINSAYGAMSKSKGATHGGHLQVALKIFHDTIRDLITIMLYARLRGWEPLYGDTDSIFVKIREGEDPNAVAEELNRVAQALGYRLSHEGTYDYMYIFAKKSYVCGEVGKYCKLKGQFIGRIKHFTSAYVRGLVLEALAKGSLKPLIEKVLQTDDVLLLIPSLSKTFTDLILKGTEEQKRMEQEKLQNYIRVLVGKPGSYRVGLLKAIRPAYINLARLGALALVYGEKIVKATCPNCGRKIILAVKRTAKRVKTRCAKCGTEIVIDATSNTYLIDFTKIEDLEDIADIRALLIPKGREKLSGDKALVAVPVGNDWKTYLVTVNKQNSFYILVGKATGIEDAVTALRYYENKNTDMEIELIPTSYDRWPGKKKMLRKMWKLLGILLQVGIISEVPIDQVRKLVLHALFTYLEWSGLWRLIKDYEEAMKYRHGQASIETFIS